MTQAYLSSPLDSGPFVVRVPGHVECAGIRSLVAAGGELADVCEPAKHPLDGVSVYGRELPFNNDSASSPSMPRI